MQKSKEDSLYQLVKSLNKSEKRFFTLHSKLFNQHKTPKYLQLYRVLEKMPHYDQTYLVEKIKNIIPSKNLNQVKRYLKVHLLEALKLYDQGSDKSIQQFGQISSAKILLERNFIPEAQNKLEAEKKQILADDGFIFANYINHLLVSCIDHKGTGTANGAKIQEAYCQDSLDLVNKQLELTKLKIISKKVQIIIESKKDKIKERDLSLRKIIESELLPLNKENYQTIKAKQLHEHIYTIIDSVLNESQPN